MPSHLPSLATAASPLPQPDQGIHAVKAEAESVAIPLCWLYALGHVPLMRPWNQSPASLTGQLASLARPSAPAAPALRRGCDGTRGADQVLALSPHGCCQQLCSGWAPPARSEWAPETPRPVRGRGRSVSVRLAGLCQDKGSGRAGQPSSLAYPQNRPGGARLCLQGSEIPCLARSAHAGERGWQHSSRSWWRDQG